MLQSVRTGPRGYDIINITRIEFVTTREYRSNRNNAQQLSPARASISHRRDLVLASTIRSIVTFNGSNNIDQVYS
ncbi:MAG: hypothetical protein WKF55_16060 [Gemmatimonadaceae bacterium]